MPATALHYVWWQIRDRAGQRLLVCLVITGAIAIPVVATRAPSTMPDGMGDIMLRGMHGQLAGLFAIILAAGVIAQDRVQGWFRFYLAKPVSPLWFYGQSILLAFAGMFMASLGVMAVLSRALDASWNWALLLDGAFAFALLGMVVVFWSSLVRYDWIAAIVTKIAADILRGRFPKEEGTLGAVLNAVLPPFHLLDITPLNVARRIPPEHVLWIAAWGVGLFLATLVVLRRRPLGED